MQPVPGLVLIDRGSQIRSDSMPTQETKQTRSAPEINVSDEKKNSAILASDPTPAFGLGFTMAVVFLLGNLLVAALFLQVFNP
jgi:hypothetical protein